MSCNKCNEVFELNHHSSKVYFMSEIDELRLKSKLFIKKLGFEPKEFNGITFIEVKDTQIFFNENIDAITNEFNELEREDIKIFIQEENQEFNFSQF